MLTRTFRAIALAAATAIAISAVSVTPASANRRGNNAAAAIAMFGIVAGTIAGIAAADARRSDWEARQRYYGGDGYPQPAPYSYYQCRRWGRC
jgi:hypothetical protein